MGILQLKTMILHDEIKKKSSYSFLRSLAKGQDHSFFKDLWAYFVPFAVLLFCIVLYFFLYKRYLITRPNTLHF
jgi:hypothetical protein